MKDKKDFGQDCEEMRFGGGVSCDRTRSNHFIGPNMEKLCVNSCNTEHSKEMKILQIESSYAGRKQT